MEDIFDPDDVDVTDEHKKLYAPLPTDLPITKLQMVKNWYFEGTKEPSDGVVPVLTLFVGSAFLTWLRFTLLPLAPDNIAREQAGIGMMLVFMALWAYLYWGLIPSLIERIMGDTSDTGLGRRTVGRMTYWVVINMIKAGLTGWVLYFVFFYK